MRLRGLLVGLIVLATIGFVVGTTIERGDARDESATHVRAQGGTAESGGGERTEEHATENGGESTEDHAAETGGGAAERSSELRPLGIDIEGVGFVVPAALASLALAGLGWLRPRWLPGLAIIAVAMLAFGVLDVREAFHQSDENRTGLVILAAVVAALHLGAGATALAMASRRDSARAATMDA